MLSTADNVFRSKIAGTALERGYDVRVGAYPQQARRACDRGGRHVIARSATSCDSQRPTLEWYPANYVTV